MNYLEFESAYTNGKYEEIKNHLQFYFYSTTFREAKEARGSVEIQDLGNGVYFDTYHFRQEVTGKNYITFERFSYDKEFLFERQYSCLPGLGASSITVHGTAALAIAMAHPGST